MCSRLSHHRIPLLAIVAAMAFFALAAGGCSSSPTGDRDDSDRSRDRADRDDDGPRRRSNRRDRRRRDRDERERPREERDMGAKVGDRRVVQGSKLGARDMAAFKRAWKLFLAKSPRWEDSRDDWLERGGAAPYVLSENLFRYFWSASLHGKTKEVDRVVENAAIIGEPAVAYFAKPLATDKVELPRPVEVEEEDPDDHRKMRTRTIRHMQIDDTTRRDAARVLVAIGPPALAELQRPAILRRGRPAARRYAAIAMGKIGTPEAVEVLTDLVRTEDDFQIRAAAVKGLGAALKNNESARAPLEEATRDKDRFVRRKAEEALAGKSKLPF